jgi:hypothetical protein
VFVLVAENPKAKTVSIGIAGGGYESGGATMTQGRQAARAREHGDRRSLPDQAPFGRKRRGAGGAGEISSAALGLPIRDR